MTDARLRFLIFGTGSIGRRHIRNIAELAPGAKFAVYRDSGAQDDFSKEIGASVFSRLDDAIAWAPTAAIIANPSHLHARLAATLLASAVPCFIEKPVATSEADLELIETAGNTDVPTQLGCVLRFLPSLRKLRSGLIEGRIGAPIRAVIEVGQYLPDWRPHQDYRESYSAYRATGGGVLYDLVHEIDLAYWLLGAEDLLGVWADKRSDLEIETEDVATLMLRGRGGAHVVVQLDYVARTPTRRIGIVGDRGSVIWDLPRRSLAWLESGRACEESSEGFDVSAAYVESMREFIAATQSGSATSLPLREGVIPARIAVNATGQIRS